MISQRLGNIMENQKVDIDLYRKIERLSDDKINELWDIYLKDKSNKEIRDKIIVQYIYLTRYVIGRVKVSLPSSFSYEDITSYGIMGLIDAVEKYSKEKGAKFETYALTRIRGTIIDKIRSSDFLPRTLRKKIKDIKKAKEDLSKKLGRTPTLLEISEVVKMPVQKIEYAMLQDTNVDSIYDTKGTGENSIEIIDTIEDKHLTPEMEAEKNDSKRELERALKKLPERERMLLIYYYHENMTLKQIGEAIKVSESRVCQIHAQAIMKLRNILSENRVQKMKTVPRRIQIRY